jgi:sec-independent protein translocase protein TatA
MFGLGYQEMIVVAILGVLLFGKRLPEVGRSLGKGIVEFKKGLRGIEDELHAATTESPRREPSRSYDAPELSVPKFEPPSSAPVARSDYATQPPLD